MLNNLIFGKQYRHFSKHGVKIAFYFFFYILIALQNLHPAEYSSWKETRTEHFIFIYEEKDRLAASEIITFCEDVYDSITTYFNSYPEEIHCIIKSRSDSVSGSFRYIPSSIVLCVTPPSDFEFASRCENWLKLLFSHELTHYIHFMFENGPFAVLSNLFGNEIKTSHAPFIYATWMIEGISTNIETLYTQGGRGRSPFFELYYKAPVIEDRLFSFEQMHYASHFPPANRNYVAGYIMVDHLLTNYGNDVFAKIHQEFMKFPFLGTEPAIIKITGKSSRELYYDMKEMLKAKYHDNKNIKSGIIISPAIQADYSHPVITDSGWYLYRENLYNAPAIVRFNADTKSEEVLINTYLYDKNSYCADKTGKNIYFTTLKYDFTHPVWSINNSDLYSFDIESREIKQITKDSHLHHPVLLPDNSKLIAVQQNGLYSRLVMVDKTSGELFLLYSQKESNVYNPVISPDGRFCAFVFNRRGMQDIYILDLLQTESIPLSGNDTLLDYNEQIAFPILGPDYAGDYFPYFIDDNTILFSSDRDGSLNLYLYNIKAGKLYFVWQDPIAAISGFFTDKDLVYSSYSSDGFCIKSISKDYIKTIPLKKPKAEKLPREIKKDNIVREKSYIDIPYPLFWLPYPSLDLNNISDYGFGVYVKGASLLNTSYWDFLLSYHPANMQLKLLLTGTFHINKFGINYLFNQYYYKRYEENNTSFNQITEQTLTVRYPLISEYVNTKSMSAFFNTGLQHIFNISDQSEFSFFDSFTQDLTDYDNHIYLFTGMSFKITKQNSSVSFYPSSGFYTLTTFTIPIFPDIASAFLLKETIYTYLPSLIKNCSMKLGFSGSYIQGEASFNNVTSPRGDFYIPSFGETGRILSSFDYYLPIVLFDTPLPLGFYFLDFAFGAYIEYLTGFNLDSGTIFFDNYLYTGIQLKSTFGHSSIRIPLEAGINLRFDILTGSAFDPQRDIKFYIQLDLLGI